MDDYQYDCPSADIDTLAHVISDLFPNRRNLPNASTTKAVPR